MHEVTPDLIAQIATRLLNETPQQSPQPTAYESAPSDATAAVEHFAPAGSFHPSSSTFAPPSVTPPVSSFASSPMSFAQPSSAVPSPSGFGPSSFALPTSTTTDPSKLSPYFGSVPHNSPPFYSPAELPKSPPQQPAHFAIPASAHSANAPGHGDVSTEGIRRFVEQIRHPSQQQEAGFCPGSPGVKFLQQLIAGKSLPGPVLSGGSRPLDIPSIRKDFPALHQHVHGKPLVWFDNAATTQKPQAVIDAISHYYAHNNSNIHRAAHTLAARSTDAFEHVREQVHQFLGAGSTREIIFVRGTTEGINLVAQTYGRKFLQPGDEILLSTLEHHANIVPWQMVAKEKGAVIRSIPVNDHGEVMLEQYQALLGPRTKLVGLTQASNSLGTILPVGEMTQLAKRYGARVLIDGAQSVSHMPVNVEQLGCDFFVFSGHKIFGPTGIGVVYAREELQEIMPPWQGGGNMIKHVTFEETSYSDPPGKFEAGTPNIADTVGLGAALDYVNRLGLTNIGKYEHHLLEYATERLLPINGLRIIGQARDKVSVISFVLKNHRTEDVGKLLDLEGIAVRSGHHCSQPSLRRYGLDATVRPSFAFYNTTDEIDHLVASIKRINTGSVKLPYAT